MQTALKTTAVVQAGGRVEVVDAALPAGVRVDVFVVLSEARPVAPRPFGLCAGQFDVPEDFDAPLPDDVLRDFERVTFP